MPTPAYIREVVTEWAGKQPDPKPLTQYERSILHDMLTSQPSPGKAHRHEST
jgi:hypothetical protein